MLQQQSIRFSARPEVGDIYRYELHHLFSGAQGIARLAISLFFFGTAWLTMGKVSIIYTLLLLVIGLLNPVVSPVILVFKARRIARAGENIAYTLNQENFTARQGQEEHTVRWRDLPKVVWTKSQLLLYTDNVHALVIPQVQMDGHSAEVLEILKNQTFRDNIHLTRRTKRCGARIAG